MTKTYIHAFITESCVDVNKGKCATDTRLIDPCSCSKYFRCVHNDMITTECPGGTAFDHTEAGASFCKTANDIFLQNICNLVSVAHFPLLTSTQDSVINA
jgi:hypothetical protein